MTRAGRTSTNMDMVWPFRGGGLAGIFRRLQGAVGALGLWPDQDHTDVGADLQRFAIAIQPHTFYRAQQGFGYLLRILGRAVRQEQRKVHGVQTGNGDRGWHPAAQPVGNQLEQLLIFLAAGDALQTQQVHVEQGMLARIGLGIGNHALK